MCYSPTLYCVFQFLEESNYGFHMIEKICAIKAQFVLLI